MKIQLLTEADFMKLEAEARCDDCGQAVAGRWKLRGVVEGKGKEIRCVCDPCFREGIRRGGPVNMIDLAPKREDRTGNSQS